MDGQVRGGSATSAVDGALLLTSQYQAVSISFILVDLSSDYPFLSGPTFHSG